MKLQDKQDVLASAKKLGVTQAQILTSAWSDADFAAFDAMARALLMDPFDLLAVIASESHTLLPSARNPADPSGWPIAVGLNQLTRVAAYAAGLTPDSSLATWKAFADAVVKAPVAGQIPMIRAYYAAMPWTKAGRRWGSAAKIYAANAGGGPAMVDVNDDTVIFPEGSAEYEGNKGLDVDGKGGLTGRDMRLAVEYHWRTPLYQAALLRMAAPALRLGYQKGWVDGQARLPRTTTTFDAVDPDFYAIAYNDGYDAGFRVPVTGALPKLPDYLT